MENDEVVIIVVLISAAVVLLTVKIIEFFVLFNEDTRYIISEIQRAYNDDEYRYWRRELRCHYLCLIPFVNERNVMRLYVKLFHKSRHGKKAKRTDGLFHILAPSVTGIFVCALCLCGASWAWFTATQTSSVTYIKAAAYTVDVTAATGEAHVKAASNNGIYTVALEADKCYEITITANGTANNGYCTVTFGEKVCYTPQIKKNTAFTFKVNAYQSGPLKITPQWGTCASSDNIINKDSPLELGSIQGTGNGTAFTATQPPTAIPVTNENTTASPAAEARSEFD